MVFKTSRPFVSSKYEKQQMCNVVISLRHRSTRLVGWNSEHDYLHCYGEACAAKHSQNNRKAELPAQAISTFMTAYSPNCELVASCHGDHNVHVTNLQSGKVVKSLIGHERSPWCISFHPTSNDIIATGCLHGEVRVWDLRGGGSESWTNDSHDRSTIPSISFHPTDHVLLIASRNGIYFWNWKFPEPFVWIKTSSPLEYVRYVRFEAQGSRIMTGIMNSEEEMANRDVEEEDEPPARMTAPPQLVARNDVWFNSWFQNSHPFLPMTSRSATSRPITAWYNLRGRQSRPPPPAEPSNSSSSNEQRNQLNSRLRQLRSDIAHAHTYSRDHRMILHARVSVQAEIQHQYNRLQLLRRERRRLEDRLRQLHNNRSSLRGGDHSSTREYRARPDDLTYYDNLPPPISFLTERLRSQLPDPLSAGPVTAGTSLPSSTSESTQTRTSATISHPSNSAGSRTAAPPPPDHPPSARLIMVPQYSNFNSIRTARSGSSSQDSSRSNDSGVSYSTLRCRRTRRTFSRRRSFFNHIWPVPENPHSANDKTSYRLQYWDFSNLEMPEISRSDINVVVRHCKIHNDSSVDVSKDGRKVAALIPSETSFQIVEVGVFSLLSSSMGCLLYRRSFDPSQYAVCLSLSPLGNYLAVGVKYYSFFEDLAGQRRTVAQILKLNESANASPTSLIYHPGRELEASGFASINTISWLPHVGQGLIYGTNNGQLRFCTTQPHQD